jgi:hypothetical protein
MPLTRFLNLEQEIDDLLMLPQPLLGRQPE